MMAAVMATVKAAAVAAAVVAAVMTTVSAAILTFRCVRSNLLTAALPANEH